MIVRKGDTVQIIAGREKGKKGQVERVIPVTGKVVVSGVNLRKRHVKPTRTSPKGGLIEFAAAMYRANVVIICPHCGKLTRGHMLMAETGKHRACIACNGNLDLK